MALCHEWVTTYGGSEQVSVRIADVLGIRDVFTFAADPVMARRVFGGRRLHVSRMGRTSLARTRWQWLLPAMPAAWRRFDLRAYDLVITSAHACVNAVRPRADAWHISYCHSPMRYAWEWRSEIGRLPAPIRPLWPAAAAALRRADARWASRVTLFLANSRNVAGRIRKFYGRSSVVVHPPISTDFWTPAEERVEPEFYLVAGRLVAYKRPGIAVRAATLAGVPLVVAGSGPELPALRRIAGPTVRFVPNPSDEDLRDLYQRARALLFAGTEDFGMTFVEAQACGLPVIAFASGGALESVRDGTTGVLYPDPSPAALAEILRTFDPDRFSPEEARRNAMRFDSARFDAAIRKVVDAATNVSVRVAATDEFAERLQKDLDVERE